MNKKGTLLATIGFAALLIFLIYSTWLISRPKPVEVQGEVDATEIKVSSKLIGRIDNLPVHKGDEVIKGQLLFTLKSPEVEAKLEQANAALRGAEAQNSKAKAGAQSEDIQAAYNTFLKAQAASELAEKTYQRVNNLYKEGVMPAQKRDEAETQYKAARETANAAKAIWVKAKKGTRVEDKATAVALVSRAEGVINEVKSYLNETKIYSPIDGEVANIIAESGELVSAGYPVVTIVNLKDCWITFNLREDLLASIHQGSTFDARFPALGNRTIKLKVTYIHPLGSFATWNATKTTGDFDMKTFEVHATPIEKVDGLRPGMSALVDWNKISKK
ncbi:MAG: efflux RND transporter periplasmic adaptor subunit [Bacteroidota bacterium]|nr:efflux RND transporter periplasmic adaptor subunit [Bacteroidota bacterium]MDP4275235.1 efflux RND transporter periplasmic adaptor subunit [Bacteroidota bacterium]